MNQCSKLEQDILKTLAFFDLFDYPLTLLEVWKWLYVAIDDQQSASQQKSQIDLPDILLALENLQASKVIDVKNGFYFLFGRQSIIAVRLQRYQLAEKKFALAMRAVLFLRYLPFIKLVAVCNNAAYNNAMATSDIDFFIIVQKGRIWQSRFFITLLLTFLGLRRSGQKITNRICLSFYLTNNHLALTDIALKPLDPYLIYWLATLAPIYDRGSYHQFLTANDWLLDYLPNFYPNQLNQRRLVSARFFGQFLVRALELFFAGFFGEGLEKLLKFIQQQKMKFNTQSLAKQPDTRVVISDEMLKFHETDRRQECLLSWQRKLAALGLN